MTYQHWILVKHKCMNFDHIKSKYQENTNLCHMNTHSFIIQIKTEDFYKGIAENIEKWFDT